MHRVPLLSILYIDLMYVLHENYWSCGRSCTKLIRGGPNFIIQKESSLVFRYKDIL